MHPCSYVCIFYVSGGQSSQKIFLMTCPHLYRFFLQFQMFHCMLQKLPNMKADSKRVFGRLVDDIMDMEQLQYLYIKQSPPLGAVWFSTSVRSLHVKQLVLTYMQR